MTAKRFTMKGSIILENGEEITAWDYYDLLNKLSEEKTKVDFYKDFQKDARELAEENEQLKFENKNLKAILNDFINILNRLQSNPTDKQTLGVARDMLQNMGEELEE